MVSGKLGIVAGLAIQSWLHDNPTSSVNSRYACTEPAARQSCLCRHLHACNMTPKSLSLYAMWNRAEVCCRPFDNNKITYLTAALASSMTTIDARDINTISAVQTVRLLCS